MKKSTNIIASTMVAGALVMQGTVSDAQPAHSVEQTSSEAIRLYKVARVPEKELADLKRRIRDTRWPDRELVNDQTQGVPQATMKALAHYWATEYDWRKVE